MNENLGADILCEIFKKLNLQERLNLEQICKKWRHIMPYSDLQSLSVAEFPFSKSGVTIFREPLGHWTNNHKTLEFHCFCKFLDITMSRCGPFIRVLKFCSPESDIRPLLNISILEKIQQLCPNIEILDCSRTLFEFVALDRINDLFPSLYRLNLCGCMLADAVQNRSIRGYSSQVVKSKFDALIDNHPALEELSLSEIRCVPNMHNANLKALTFQKSHKITAKHVESIAANCPLLRKLDLSGCLNLSGISLGISNLLKLQHLRLDSTSIDDRDLALICHYCERITSLHIEKCVQLQDFTPMQLLSNLKEFSVGPSLHFTDANIHQLAIRGNLTFVSIAGCHVSDQSLSFLAENNANLTFLNVGAAVQLTNEAICSLLLDCKLLQTLILNDCPVGNLVLKAVAKFAQNLRILDVRKTNIDQNGIQALIARRESRWLQVALPILTILVDKNLIYEQIGSEKLRVKLECSTYKAGITMQPL